MDNVTFRRVINLGHRTDRWNETLQEMKRMGLEMPLRFDAHSHPNGAVGCASSHMTVLQEALIAGAETAWVFEDDVQFLVSPSLLAEMIKEFLDGDADVLCLGWWTEGVTPSLHSKLLRRATNIQTTSCYIAKRKAIPELVSVFKTSVMGLLQGGHPRQFAADQIWKPLQLKNEWVICFPRAVTQRASFSDIERRVIDYETILRPFGYGLECYEEYNLK